MSTHDTGKPSSHRDASTLQSQPSTLKPIVGQDVSLDASSSSQEPLASSSRLSSTGLEVGLGANSPLPITSAPVEDESSSASTTEQQKALTAAQLAANTRLVDAAAAARTAMTASALSAFGITLDLAAFSDDPPPAPLSRLKRQPTSPSSPSSLSSSLTHRPSISKTPRHPATQRLDFFSALSSSPELLMELAKHLRIPDLLSLYAISRDFHDILNGHLSHCMRACAAHQAPESASLFKFKFYASLCVPDPTARLVPPVPPNSTSEPQQPPGSIRKVPSLRWLAMVVYREKCVRDILACLARQGLRCKPGMALTLKKTWLLMDIATTVGRVQLMHNRTLWTDFDLYNLQFFVCRLDMRFNDPIDGPGTEDLRKLMLGQRSLTPLCQMLKREKYLAVVDIVKLAVRYSYTVRPEHRMFPIFGIHPQEIGIGHLEGWGRGKAHLARPDELVMMESVRRGLGLKEYLLEMMTWGYIDPVTSKNIPVTEEEMYMSEEEGSKGKGKVGWSDYFEPEGSASEGSEEEDDEDDEDDEDEYSGEETQ